MSNDVKKSLTRPMPQKEVDAVKARKTMRVKSLAEFIRSEMHPKDFFHWLREVAAGRDPDAVDGQFAMPIEMRYRMKAMQMLLERAYGGVPQHVTLEAELGAVVVGKIDAPAWESLEDAKLKSLRETIRALLNPGGVVVDAEVVENKK
jgi:hypothetical protein